MFKINAIGTYRISWALVTAANKHGLMGSTSTTLSTFSFIALFYDSFNSAAWLTEAEFILNVTTVPYYIFPGVNSASTINGNNDPWFMVTQIPVSASLTQQNYYLNSISGASDSTVSAPQSSQVLAYNGSSWTNTTLALPNQTSYIRGFNTDLTAHTFTNSTQVGAYYMFDLFALSAYSIFVNSADWQITNAWTMTYIGSSPQTFWINMSYTNVAGTGLNIIVCLNSTIIYASYMGSVAGQQSSF